MPGRSPLHDERAGDDGLAAGVRHVVNARLTKVLLAVLVIVSLLPLGALDAQLRPVFLVAFGAELLARAWLWLRGREGTTRARVASAVVDALAWASFLPLESLFDGRLHVLALLRLSRLLLLLRFARALARDLYAIVTRREQLQQLGLVTGAVLVLSFVSAVILSQLSIGPDDGAQPVFVDQLWWSFRQLESADNLVPSLRVNPVLAALSLFLTVTGVFVISFIIGIGTNIVDQVVRAERVRPLQYRGHTVVVGDVHGAAVLIREFVRIYAKNRQVPAPEQLWVWFKHAVRASAKAPFPRVALLGPSEKSPLFLVEPLMRWVVYREGHGSEPQALDRVAAQTAKRAIVLSRPDLQLEADAATVATLAALRAQNADAHAFVELSESSTVSIAQQVGGKNTFALDMPRLLGMFLCQHLVTPGVESLYRDLLTADGSELYTHVFLEGEEPAGRATGTTSFAQLSKRARAHGVVLVGVLLGPAPLRRTARDAVPIEGLVPWLNPLSEAVPPAVAALGGAPDVVPWSTLRGFIGIADSYLPLRDAAQALLRDDDEGAGPAAAPLPPLSLSLPGAGPSRVAMIGFSTSLPSFLRELAAYVPGIDVTLFLSARGDERLSLPRRLESLNVGFDAEEPAPGTQGRSAVLPHGGRITVYTHDGNDLAGFAASRLQSLEAKDAVVFLSEPEGADRDARIALRVLRFTRALEDGVVPHKDTMHLLAEFVSIDKGAHIQRVVDVQRCGFADASKLKLTLVSTETIRGYFLVHAAFVPGVSDVYDELLQERGQDIVRLGFDAAAHGVATLTLAGLQEQLLHRQMVPIGVELVGGRVLLGPPAFLELPASSVVGIYVVAEAKHVPRLLGLSGA